LPEQIGEALRLTENSLRNVIAEKLLERFGNNWIEKCGVTPERLQRWKERRDIERKSLSTGTLENRLIYFADFTDLQTIITKNWDDFKLIFGEKKEFEVFLSTLEDFRNPEAHQRGLLPYQEQLVTGICGDLRTRIARFRSTKKTTQDCFPRIDNAYDNHGHSHDTSAKPVLRVGDRIEVVVEASDPENLTLYYHFTVINGINILETQEWSPTNSFILDLTQNHIGKELRIWYEIRSDRKYHASGRNDDASDFVYIVLPNN
jgi:hypothetical protein